MGPLDIHDDSVRLAYLHYRHQLNWKIALSLLLQLTIRRLLLATHGLYRVRGEFDQLNLNVETSFLYLLRFVPARGIVARESLRLISKRLQHPWNSGERLRVLGSELSHCQRN